MLISILELIVVVLLTLILNLYVILREIDQLGGMQEGQKGIVLII